MKWTHTEVARRFEKALFTLKKLPSIKVQGYLSSMPHVLRTIEEIKEMDPKLIRLKATPEEITELEQTLIWIRWVSIDERKLIWKKAARIPEKIIAYEFQIHRASVSRDWKNALLKICKTLNS